MPALAWLMLQCRILLAFVLPTLADAIYALVARLWLVPDRRYEAAMRRGPEEPTQRH